MWHSLLLALLSLLSLSIAQTCYNSGGSIDTSAVPCSDSSNEPTNCCTAEHVCLSNGLCYTPDGMTIYRGACTDKTFQSAACGQYCLGYLYSGLWPCDGDSNYACNLTGCAAGQAFKVAGAGNIVLNVALSSQLGLSGSGATATTTVTQATATATATITMSPSSLASLTADSSPTNNQVSKSQVTAVGAGVGVPLGIALLAALGLLWREHKRYKRLLATHNASGVDGYALGNSTPAQQGTGKKNPAEGFYGAEMDTTTSSPSVQGQRPTPYGGRFHEAP